jgi:hypothetical protein
LRIGKKNVRVAKETLSKLLFCLQELRAITIEKQKYEWDAKQDNNFNEGLDVAHSKGALMDALRALRTNLTSKLLVALKDWESKEFQISKKANVQKNVCNAFEE